jgi:predicted membrane-bound mannosyltransferase
MMKAWYEAKPFTFGAVFIFFYMTIPILDQLYMNPTMKPICNGQITDQQVRMCTDWIIKKDKARVPKTTNPLGGLYRNPPSNIERQWE